MSKFKENLPALIVCLLLSLILALVLFLHATWDFYTFHHYNGWAFLNNRYDIDVMPTLFRTYFNPIVDAFSYWMLNKLNFSAILYAVIDNLWYCAFIFISYLIFKNVFGFKTKENRLLVASCFLLTVFSPILLQSHRLWCAMPQNVLALLSMYLFIKVIVKKESSKNIALILSAFLLGLATGLKYTFVSFIPAWIICFIVNFKSDKKFLGSFFIMILSMFCGFMLGGGWLMCYLFNKFHNPVYPYFNNIFNPEDDSVNPIFKQDFYHLKPKNLLQFIFYPLMNSRIFENIGLELKWFDLKVPLAFISLILYFITAKIKNVRNYLSEIIDPRVFNLVIIYTVTAWIINLALFGVIRYLMILIPLAVIIVAVVCGLFLKITDVEEKLPSIFVTGLIILTSFYAINFSKLFGFAYLLYVMFWGVSLFIFSFYTKMWENIKSKGFIVSMFLIFTVSLGTYVFPFTAINFFYSENPSVLNVENLGIEDDAVVFMPITSTFIVPSQNPKAQYVGLTIPASYFENYKYTNDMANFIFYDKKLEKITEKLIREKNNVYFLCRNNDTDLGIYRNYLSYYVKHEVQYNMSENCRKVIYTVDGYYSNTNQYVICKIK